MDPLQPCIGPYLLVRNLGSGAASKIKLAIHNETKQPIAIKIIKKDSFQENPQLQIKVQREIALMRLFDHPHILKLLDILESPRHLYIGLEYASEGELFQYVVAKGKLSEAETMHFFRQIIYGLEYLHSLGICHRDMKPENILLDSRKNIKIADFGFARFSKQNVAETSCGSPHYVAPEVIGGNAYDGRSADVWSCGVILYAMLTGTLPFDDNSIRTLLIKVRKAKYVMPNVSSDFQDLIAKMLTKDPKQRITISDIKKHPAFNIGLPKIYTQPTPFPLPSLSEPVDITYLNEELKDILMKIGYDTEQELINDLSCSSQTMAKVFYSMLTTRMMLDQLNWDKCVGSNESMSSSSSYDSFIFDPSVNTNDDFALISGQSASYLNPQSLANPADWALPLNQTPQFSATKMIPLDAPNVFTTMSCVQISLSQLHMQWFYPDESMIICREAEKSLYVIIQFIENQGISLQMCQGFPENFTYLCTTIEETYNKYMRFCEEDE